MKAIIAAVALTLATGVMAADPKVNPQITDSVTQKAPANDNCVKKDKNGKCPPLPNSPKPTPKKKAEEVKKA